MALERSPRFSGRRRLLIPAALVGWLVVVVVGAGRDQDEGPLLGVENLEAVLLVAWLVISLIGVVLLFVLNPFQRKWTEPSRSKWAGVGWLLILALLVLMIQQDLLSDFFESSDETEQEEQQQLGSPAEEDTAEDLPVETVAEATDILILLAAVGAVAAVWILLRQQTESGQTEAEGRFEQELLAAMEEADLVLADGDDPRTAVLNAYATLERVIASRGPGRRPAETTSEHARRVMGLFGTDSAPVEQLARLYELARFSDRPITGQHRDEAAQALQRARAKLVTSP